MLLPLALQPPAERGKPLAQRYWVKANLWIATFSFIGNYFWTHYFYRLLGASYTFPAHRLNQAWPGFGGGGGCLWPRSGSPSCVRLRPEVLTGHAPQGRRGSPLAVRAGRRHLSTPFPPPKLLGRSPSRSTS